MLSRLLAMGVITTYCLLSGLTPNLAGRSTNIVLSSIAYAQAATSGEIKDEEVIKFAQSLIQIELTRQDAYNKIKKITGQEPPPISCNEPQTMDSLSDNQEALKIAQDYCQKAEMIAKDNLGSTERFNDITKLRKTDSSLESRIQAQLKRLLGSSP